MTTQTTLTTVETNENQFVAFAMDKSTGITVSYIESQLVGLGVSFKKKDTKEVKARLWFQALEAQASAIGETPVAETKPEEEVVMTNTKEVVEKELRTIQNEKNMRALLASRITKNFNHVSAASTHAVYENPSLVDMLTKVNAAKDRYLRAVGENGVIVEDIHFYPEKAEATRYEISNKKFIREYPWKNKEGFIRIVGEVIVRMPKGYALIKQWNKNKVNSKGRLGAPEFVPFEDMDINLATKMFDSRKPLADGSGLVSLSITEMKLNDGTIMPLSVQLPEEKWNDGSKHEIFRTADVRYAKTKDTQHENEPQYLRDNNDRFNAQVTAIVRVRANEFIQALPENRHGHNDVHCQEMVKFQVKDGVTDDLEAGFKKSRTILEQPDIMQLAQVGSEQPQAYCMVRNIWLDEEGVHILNEAEQHERATFQDEDGNFQYQRHDEIMIAGKAVKRNTVREMSIRKNCETCPFYCGNSPKSDAQIAREKALANENGGGYVSPFFRAKAKPERQAVETLVTVNNTDSWKLGFPGEFLGKVDDIKSVRIKGAGLTTYVSPNVVADFDPTFIAPVEEFDARHAEVMKSINHIFHAAFNYDTLDAEQIEAITELVENKPEGLTRYEEEKWDKAIFWFMDAIRRDLEYKARNQSQFPQHFFPGVVTSKKIVFEGKVKGKTPFMRIPANMTELHVEDIMSERMERNERSTFKSMADIMDGSREAEKQYSANRNDFIHSVYNDLNGVEFVRYLDDSAIDYVYDVILEGTEFSIVGGTDEDKKLAADALQVMLQQELSWNFVKGIRRDENPMEALLKLKVTDDVKYYIATVVGLIK